MIAKMNNTNDKFYSYMGKFFGSRLLQKQTGDRIYDDSSKEWYIYLINEKAVGFVSISNNVIKNLYATDPKYLVELLTELNKSYTISSSVVTNLYVDVYKSCNFLVNTDNYKNFVIISRSLKSKN